MSGNRYAYAVNNPARYVDRNGLFPEEPPINWNPHYEDPDPRDIARQTKCCQVAKKFGLNPAAVCAVAWYETTYYNIFSWIEDVTSAINGTPPMGIRETVGPYGLAPYDLMKIASKAGSPDGGLRTAREISELYPSNLSGTKATQALLEEGPGMEAFAAIQSTRVGGKPQTAEQQAESIMGSHNPATGFRARVIRYRERWLENRKQYVLNFEKICEEECK